MLASILKSTAIGIFLCASSASAIANWDITFINLLTDFSKDSTNEATLNYELGKGRSSYQVDLFNKGCATSISGTIVGKTTSTAEKDPVNADLDNLEILLDFDKQTMATSGSSIWNSLQQEIELCVRVQLLSATGDIITEDKRDIDIAFDFDVDFTTQEPVNMQAASLSSGSITTYVDNYVQACTCDDATSFTCNTDTLGPNSLLNICISSTSSDMNVNYIDNLKMTQGAEEFVIIETGTLQDSSISSSTLVPASNGAHVATIIPSTFFSYSSTSTAVVTGVVKLKLVGTRRELAVKISGYPKVQTTSSIRALNTDEEDQLSFNRADALSTKKTLFDDQVDQFSFPLQLARKELEVTEQHINGATMTNTFLVFATAIGAFVIML